jgi:serine protease Do
VLTAAHVLDDCPRATISQSGSRPVPVRVVATDKTNDLALLKAEIAAPVSAQFRSGARLGEGVAVFGFPLSGLLATSGNFTLGNITGLAGLLDDTRMMQMSAPVQPGNSGGPVLDQSGNIVGVVVAKLDVLKLAAHTDDVAQNVNFAIKTTVALNFLEANGVTPIMSSPGQTLAPADLADKAKSFAVLVECQ